MTIKKKIIEKVIKTSEKLNAKKTTFVKHQTKLKEGDLAPFFEGIDQNGKMVSLHDFTKKTLVLYFYPKDDTPGCTAQACSLRDEYHYLTKKEYAVVGVSKDSEKSHQKFSKKFDLPFSLLPDVDLKIIKDYDVWGKKMFMGRVFEGVLRTTFVIKNKKIIRVISEVDTKEHAKQLMTEND
ncbi:MAG: thioredoxin-dependent thiol peroxidase [Bacteroidetes bacterium]|nr:thioredoxin-dependent thiol peroxidase [Bacteroidota bacterium]